MMASTTSQSGKITPAVRPLQKAALLCGLLAPLLFIATDFLAVTRWEEYNFISSQSISELSAPAAPTRTLVVTLNIIYYLLMIAFGSGVWNLAAKNRPLRLTAGLLLGSSVINLVALFFPMHPGEPVGTFANTMNVVIMGTGVILLFLAIGSGAFAFRNWFRFYSIGIFLAFLVLTMIGIWIAPRMVAGEPVSRVGIQERVMSYGSLLWVGLLAIAILRAGSQPDRTRV
jgi:hypothetical protein